MTTMTAVERLVREREAEFFTRSMIEYPQYLRAEAEWVRDTLTAAAAATGPSDLFLDDDGVARLALALTSIEVRDVAWTVIRYEDADKWLAFWMDVVARIPRHVGAAPAALAAFAAWMYDTPAARALAMDAASAALDVDPNYRMAQMVMVAVASGLPAAAWEPAPLDELPIFQPQKK